MTHKIPKSILSSLPQFDIAVAAHAKEHSLWLDQMKRVEADKVAGVHPDKAHQGYPPPKAHPMVAAAVNEHGLADYEVVNDDPPPAEVLRRKKRELTHEVARIENELLDVIVPSNKRRLLALRLADVNAADQVRRAAALANLSVKSDGLSELRARGAKGKENLGAKIAQVEEEITVSNRSIGTEVWHAARRDEDHQKLVDTHALQSAKMTEINRWAAQMLSDIEDLTTSTVDQWKITPFKPN